MDVFSTELGIRLSFVKNSEFRVRGIEPPLRYATAIRPVGEPGGGVVYWDLLEKNAYLGSFSCRR
jgi:hypothetical protein